ncbi:MAG TPA: hypothetical protein VG013_28910 [Gemmataceae bacterium]|jgi:hypothetical protein|nr:hypothetical protein [Gemmataceae bacterium]
MTQVIDSTHTEAAAGTDLVAAVQQVLRASDEPLTLSKIRAHLPSRFRSMGLEELAEALHRQVAANVLVQYPKYRSQQDRFWDRPMAVHVTALLRLTLEEGPLAWSELRRKLPAYAQAQAEAVLAEQVAQGALYRHPKAGRGGERFGVAPADPKDYLRTELVAVFHRLEQLGFNQAQLREGALELLHEEEWAQPATAGDQPVAEPARKPEQASAEAPSGQEPSPEPTTSRHAEPDMTADTAQE